MASRSSSLHFHRRLYSTFNQWSVRQVRKSDFHGCLGDLDGHISASDFIALSLQKTGSSSFPWHRLQPFDTSHTAYCKAKYAAEKFQILQFALCPFSVRESKLIAHPYNFHLFPRDELNIGMPSYSFSCQVSHLTSMAREGFDFDACIYDGISYLSRAQESIAKVRMGCPTPTTSTYVLKSSSRQSIADSVFIQRVKSRVKNWKDACNSSTKTNAKGGGTQAIRAILTSSKDDKILLEKELQNLEEEENKRFRGFREVIDMISASQKPIVSYGSLNGVYLIYSLLLVGLLVFFLFLLLSSFSSNAFLLHADFTFIHSKFLAPLPPRIDEFSDSLHSVFPQVLDVQHLMRNISGLNKPTSISSALSYLKNHYFAPVDLDIPVEGTGNERKFHGHNAIKLCHLFTKVCSVLKIDLSGVQFNEKPLASNLEGCANVFASFPPCNQEPEDEGEDVKISTRNVRKVSCGQLVFLWGFRDGMTAGLLKAALQGSHEVLCEEFDVRFVGKKCAILVFWQPGLSETFLDAIHSDGILGSLKDMVSEGLRAASYETYKRVCRLGHWEADLAESLERATSEADCETARLDIYYSNNSLINLNDL
ncbi:poly(A)-specific ribonuclease PARN-like isoform X3 [Momordica charantia]|uniref:Poly(A)-specific ribonuclease PARN-like isoform X3 n=1 Tax=Momordica charantia TaxID=3673 RepID=A0A6J1CP73_MOMCH|nr:poly(A)-specific ribonuclease PARN-like isoform X3 [Momordica charantia]